MTLTKAELADILVEKVSSVSKTEAKEIVELFFEEIRSVLARGEEIKISGFGNCATNPNVRAAIRKPAKKWPFRRAASLLSMPAKN